MLPPLNNGTDVRGTYGYLSTVTRPLAELGYYVFPVAVVDQFLKENGLPGPGEMQQAPLDKLAGIFGADAVMYITLEQYGTRYNFLSSGTRVKARARLIETKTGLLIWEGATFAQQSSNGGGGGGIIGILVQAAVSQAINSSADTAHEVSRSANVFLFTGNQTSDSGSAAGSGGPALLLGPYRPETDTVH